MTVHICLLKHIFNLIENGDQKDATSDTMCCIIFHGEKSAVETSRVICDTYEHTVSESTSDPGSKDFKVEISMLK